MKLLKNLLITEGADDTALPQDTISKIQSNIRKGAADLKQGWANALQLTQRAYEVTGVERPTPDMKSGWTQYEKNIQFAVEQLSKARGLKGDWRMSAAIFHEATEQLTSYKLTITKPGKSEYFATVEAKRMSDIIDALQRGLSGHYDIDVKHQSSQKCALSFSKWGIKRKMCVRIEKNQDLH
ncbi:MAG: hypothetical protein ACREAU_00085 [Nitrosopumilaceae archaeon]